MPPPPTSPCSRTHSRSTPLGLLLRGSALPTTPPPIRDRAVLPISHHTPPGIPKPNPPNIATVGLSVHTMRLTTLFVTPPLSNPKPAPQSSRLDDARVLLPRQHAGRTHTKTRSSGRRWRAASCASHHRLPPSPAILVSSPPLPPSTCPGLPRDPSPSTHPTTQIPTDRGCSLASPSRACRTNAHQFSGPGSPWVHRSILRLPHGPSLS